MGWFTPRSEGQTEGKNEGGGQGGSQDDCWRYRTLQHPNPNRGYIHPSGSESLEFTIVV
jgi:hypothetical protein